MPARPERQRLPPVAVSLPIAGAFVIAATLWATPFAAFCALLGIVVVALAGLAVLRRLDTAEPGRRAALFALGPCVLFGAGLADLNDALWMAACLMALAAALDRRHILMLLCWGSALGIDPQAMFVAPFFWHCSSIGASRYTVGQSPRWSPQRRWRRVSRQAGQ